MLASSPLDLETIEETQCRILLSPLEPNSSVRMLDSTLTRPSLMCLEQPTRSLFPRTTPSSWEEQERRQMSRRESTKFHQPLDKPPPSMTRRSFRRDLEDSPEELQSLRLEEPQRLRLESSRIESRMPSALPELPLMRESSPEEESPSCTPLELWTR